MQIKSLSQRILAVMRDVGYIQKLDKKVNGQYRYVSHDQVMGALRKPMVEHGIISSVTVLAHVQDGNRTEVDIELSLINADDPDDRMAVKAFGYGIDSGDKGPGKAVSYAVKYALLKTFCLETGDDPDSDASAVHEPGNGKRQVPVETEAEHTDRINRLKRISVLIGKLDNQQMAKLRDAYPRGTKGMTVEELDQLETELTAATTTTSRKPEPVTTKEKQAA